MPDTRHHRPVPTRRVTVDPWPLEHHASAPVGRWRLILHDDDRNGIEFVARGIRRVLGYPWWRCLWLTLRAHFGGQALLLVCPKELAEHRQQQFIALGPDPDGKPGATPLDVSIEAAPAG